MKEKIIFFGTSEFAVPPLGALLKDGAEIAGVITAPDKPAGRGKKIKASPVKEFALKEGLAVFTPEKSDMASWSKIIPGAGMGVVAAYGKILPKDVISLFQKGILNIHPSLLPKFRGASPIENTILAGEESRTGVTIILMDEKMDHGPVIAQRKLVNISSSPSYSELHDALSNLGAEMLSDIIPKWTAGGITPLGQDHGKATFTKLIKKDDGRIDWSKDAAYIERMIRAYERWPGAYFDGIKIQKAEVISGSDGRKPGQFFEEKGFPAVACGTGALKLLTVQPAGKNEMPGDAYLRGHREIISG